MRLCLPCVNGLHGEQWVSRGCTVHCDSHSPPLHLLFLPETHRHPFAPRRRAVAAAAAGPARRRQRRRQWQRQCGSLPGGVKHSGGWVPVCGRAGGRRCEAGGLAGWKTGSQVSLQLGGRVGACRFCAPTTNWAHRSHLRICCPPPLLRSCARCPLRSRPSRRWR